MSDERFNDAIRDALLADDPGTVPTRLRSRMAMIPDEAAGQTVVANPWRARFNRYALPASVLAAAAIIVVVCGGIALRGQQMASVAPSAPVTVPSPVFSPAPSGANAPSPTVAPSVDATPEPTASATAEPTATPKPSPMPTGPITLDPGKLVGVIDGSFAISGDRVFFVNRSGQAGIGWISLTDSTKSGGVVMLDNGHDIGAQVLTDTGVVWLETWYTDPPMDCTNQVPCSPHGGQPISWKLNFTTLDGTTTTKLDSGVVSRISVEGEGATPLPPEIAAQGGRVAYAVPRTVSGKPQASRIIVRSLPDGAVVRTIDTNGYVAQLGVFGQALIYRRAIDTTQPTDPSQADLNVVTDDSSQPYTLDSPVAQATIGDGGAGGSVRIVWMSEYTVAGDIRWTTPGATKFNHVDVANKPLNNFDPVVIGDGFAWLSNIEAGDGTSSFQVQAWLPGWGTARVVTSLESPDSLVSTDGWLLAIGGQMSVPQQAVRAADLFAK
jgi:hypothetical protein